MAKETFGSYEEWKGVGRVVRKGEKCVGFNLQGKAMFTFDQTDDINKRHDYHFGGGGDPYYGDYGDKD